jgi:hypothetical protein
LCPSKDVALTLVRYQARHRATTAAHAGRSTTSAPRPVPDQAPSGAGPSSHALDDGSPNSAPDAMLDRASPAAALPDQDTSPTALPDQDAGPASSAEPFRRVETSQTSSEAAIRSGSGPGWSAEFRAEPPGETLAEPGSRSVRGDSRPRPAGPRGGHEGSGRTGSTSGRTAVPRPAPDDLRLPDLDVRDVVWHSRQENDWYAATVTVDCIAFLYVAFLFQVSTTGPARAPWQLCTLRYALPWMPVLEGLFVAYPNLTLMWIGINFGQSTCWGGSYQP